MAFNNFAASLVIILIPDKYILFKQNFYSVTAVLRSDCFWSSHTKSILKCRLTSARKQLLSANYG